MTLPEIVSLAISAVFAPMVVLRSRQVSNMSLDIVRLQEQARATEQMHGELRTLREAISKLTETIARLETRLEN